MDCSSLESDHTWIQDSTQRRKNSKLNGKLVLYKPILENQQYVVLIIIPQSLRRIVLIHFHAGPSGGPMGEYKTLHRMRLQLFWPKLIYGVKQWVKVCAQYVS